MRGAAALLAAVLALSGCEAGGDSTSTKILSDTLSVYTSVPLRGLQADEGRAFLRGEKLALDEARGRAGKLDIGLIALDNTKPQTGEPDPARVAQNARLAADNPATIAYIGELDSDTTAVSLPIMNEVGVVQVAAAGAAELDAPELYPSGTPNLARLLPTPEDEARALAEWMAETGARRATVTHEPGFEGDPVVALQRAGLEVGSSGDAHVYAGADAAKAAAVLDAAASRDGRQPLFTIGIDPAELSRHLRRATVRSLWPLERAGPELTERYRALFGEPPGPAAQLGYAAMRGVLQAVADGGADRRKVLEAHAAAPEGPYGYVVRRGAVRFTGPLG